MRKKITFFLFLFLFSLNNYAQKNCAGHEKEIEKRQTERATKMGMIVNSIVVEYLGKCQYRCVSDVYDPGNRFSSPNNITSTIIYKWTGQRDVLGNKYVFVRKEED